MGSGTGFYRVSNRVTRRVSRSIERVSSIGFLYYRKKLLRRHTRLIFPILILPYLPHYSTHHLTLTVLFNTEYYMFYTLPIFLLLFMFNQSLIYFLCISSSSPYVSPYISPGPYVCINGYIAGTETGNWTGIKVGIGPGRLTGLYIIFSIEVSIVLITSSLLSYIVFLSIILLEILFLSIVFTPLRILISF